MMAVSATRLMHTLAVVISETEKPGQSPVLHAAHGTNCVTHNCRDKLHT